MNQIKCVVSRWKHDLTSKSEVIVCRGEVVTPHYL